MRKILGSLILLSASAAIAQVQPGQGNFLIAADNNQQQLNGSNNQLNSSLINSNQNYQNGTVITVKMPQRSIWQKLREDTSFTYYQQFLGPTAAGRADQTYNVFQAASSGPEQKSGRAPIQSFHAVNLRHQINANWSVGVSLAVSKGYAGEVRNQNGDLNKPKDQFFNARAFVNVPPARFNAGTLFTTISYEAPTSVISRQENMRYGLVLAESFALKMPSYKWSGGWTAQAYRMFYKQNVVPYYFPDGSQGIPTQQQTLILSTGPYLNYSINEHWTATSSVILDWDQRGNQSNTTNFNNNLPHRGRMGISYMPTNPYLRNVSSVGLFTQALLKFRPETTAFGFEFALRF